ncbi:MAG TPA: TrmB family transcriptional regulator [Chloroflexia bacterium]|nr:TrmB family transcriptional regulator [Chloroflexia bacterium]
MRDPKQVSGSPRAEVLRNIQRLGSASIKELEAVMGVTTTAVREQIAHLMREDFIQATRVRGDVGRPYYVYSLTTRAQELFPKDYATLALLLLEETRDLHGPEGLRMLLNRVSRRMAEKLSDHTQGKELSQKLLGLVAALGETGMEVSMVPVDEGSGGFILTTRSCPYFEVAQTRREVCEMEQEMLSDLLGQGVDVQLKGRIVDGQCACEFHVSHVSLDASMHKSKVTSAGVPE